VWKKSIQNYESKMNEDSKALDNELVKGKIIPKIKEVNDYELTQEEIDLICIHLDKEIKDLNNHIKHEKCTRLRKQARQKRTKIKRYKRHAYRHDKYVFRRDFKLYECDDCSECPLKNHCMKPNSKSNKK